MKTTKVIGPDNKTIFVIPKNSLNFFTEEGFKKIPKNNLSKKIFYILSSIKWITQIVSIFLKCKFHFKNPIKTNYLIFDKECEKICKEVFIKKNYTTLPSRIKDFSEIYLTLKILRFMFNNFKTYSLKISYLIALIKIQNPKSIISEIDTSEDFQKICKYFKGKIHTILIQGSHKPMNLLPKVFIPDEYYTIGKFEKIELKKRNKKVPYIKAIGSLRAEIAKKKLKKKLFNEKNFDICLISEPDFFLNKDAYKNVKNTQKYLLKAAEFTLKFCKKYNKKLIFSGKSNKKNNGAVKREKFFYENLEKKFNYKISFGYRNNYHVYKNIKNSKLVIGVDSTCLREAVQFKKKFLKCNFIKSKATRFPGKGIHKLDSINYTAFETRVKRILNMNFKNFCSNVSSVEDICSLEFNPIKVIRKRLNII